MKDSRIREALDRNLSGLHVTGQQHRMMMDTITGGIYMKKKFSVGLVVMAALLCLSVTAVAATIMNRMFEQVIDMEVENGAFSTWSYEDRLRLIELLSENGWVFPDDPFRKLSDGQTTAEEKNAIVTSLLTDALGREDAISHIVIIEQVKGPMSTWSVEDKAWYSDYLRSKRLLLDSWRDVLPEERDLSVEEAVQIAAEALCAAFQMDAAELQLLMTDVSFFVDKEHSEPRWSIAFQTDPFGAPEYTVLLTRSGELTEDERLGILTPEHDAVRRSLPEEPTDIELLEAEKGPSDFWSLEDKAACLGEENGLPANDDIRPEEAVRIATEAVRELGVDTAPYSLSLWSKLYDPYGDELKGPFYLIYFIDHPTAPYNIYSVIIDPRTGEVIQTNASDKDSHG